MNTKANILKAHSIGYIEFSNGTIIAKEDDGTLTNVTDMSLRTLYEWLGY